MCKWLGVLVNFFLALLLSYGNRYKESISTTLSSFGGVSMPSRWVGMGLVFIEVNLLFFARCLVKIVGKLGSTKCQVMLRSCLEVMSMIFLVVWVTPIWWHQLLT